MLYEVITAFFLSVYFQLPGFASWILGFLTLVPAYMIYRWGFLHPRSRKNKPRRRIRISDERGKVLPFPDSGRKTNHME